MGIRHVRCMPQHPQSNGKIKRFNRTFKEILAKAVNNAPSDWEDHVGSTLLAHQISTSEVTHYHPFYLLFARQPRVLLSRLLGLHTQDAVQGFGTMVDTPQSLRPREFTQSPLGPITKLELAKRLTPALLSLVIW